jgi:hypothetical protein
MQVCPPPAGYRCSLCPKSYKTPESLSRHAKIHQESRDHVCPVCKIGFTRRDILLRHGKIHASTVLDVNDPGNSHSAQSGDNSAVSRIRSTRACDFCSRHRVKCDGRDPCGRCNRTERQCQYSRKRVRHSKIVPSRQSTEPVSRPDASNNRPRENETSASPSHPHRPSFSDEVLSQDEYDGMAWTPLTPFSAIGSNCPLPEQRTFAQAPETQVLSNANSWSTSAPQPVDIGNWQWLFDEVLFQAPEKTSHTVDINVNSTWAPSSSIIGLQETPTVVETPHHSSVIVS